MVVECCEGVDFIVLAAYFVRVGHTWQHQLDRDLTRKQLVDGAVHRSHAPAADEAGHTVAATDHAADDLVIHVRGWSSRFTNRHANLLSSDQMIVDELAESGRWQICRRGGSSILADTRVT
jgi:hypothetical protein